MASSDSVMTSMFNVTDVSTQPGINTSDFVTTENSSWAFENSTLPTTPYVKQFYEYDLWAVSDWLFKHSWKFIAPPGLVGNFLVILVTLRMRPFNSTSFFMTTLAMVDLLLICIRITIKELSFLSDTPCKVLWYFYNVLPMSSNYILVFWTIERLIAVRFPLKVADWCTIRNATIAVSITIVSSFALNVPWPLSIVKSEYFDSCAIDADWYLFIYDVWYIIDSSFFIFIPMTVILVCNILIITNLRESTKRHKQMTSSEDSRKIRDKEQRNVTITLLTVSFAFIILHIPLAVYNTQALSKHEITDHYAYAVWDFINVCGISFAEFQNSLNFYLYFLTGRKYRQNTVNLFFGYLRKRLNKRRERPTSAGTKATPSSTKVTSVSK